MNTDVLFLVMRHCSIFRGSLCGRSASIGALRRQPEDFAVLVS